MVASFSHPICFAVTYLCILKVYSPLSTPKALEVSDEKRLIKHLMDFYTEVGTIGRPVIYQNESSRVEFGLDLIQILDLDERNQILTTNVWCKYKWLDHYLTWNEADYGGVDKIRIPIQYIWKPDFVLYNFAGERYTEQSDAMAVITSDGNVTWIPPAILKSTCEIDATLFPFDEQLCLMKFGSWTYNQNSLDPFFYDGQDFISLDDYVSSNEWAILEHSGKKNLKVYECCPDGFYPDLTFLLSEFCCSPPRLLCIFVFYTELHRKATFYNYILILPSVLLSVMTLVMFILPPEAPAKISLGINIIASFFLLLILLQEATPTASHRIPVIGAYYCFNMIVTTFSTVFNATVVNFHFGADKRGPPPNCLRNLAVRLAPLVVIRVPKRLQLPTNKQPQSFLNSNYAASDHQERRRLVNLSVAAAAAAAAVKPSTSCQAFPSPLTAKPSLVSRPVEPSSLPTSQHSCLSQLKQSRSSLSGDSQFSLEMIELREMKNLMVQYLQKTQAKEQTSKSASDWRFIARVLDRVFFIVYIAGMIVSMAIFSLRPFEELSGDHRFHNDTASAANNRTNSVGEH